MSFIFDDLRIKDGKFVANYKEPYGNLMKKVLEYHNDNDPFFQTIEPENEPDNKRKNRALDPVHPTWLRDQDSNLEPSPYTYLHVAMGRGLYHHPGLPRGQT